MHHFLHVSCSIRLAVIHAIKLLIFEAGLDSAVVSPRLRHIASAVFFAMTHAANGDGAHGLLICVRLSGSVLDARIMLQRDDCSSFKTVYIVLFTFFFTVCITIFCTSRTPRQKSDTYAGA